MNNHQPLPRKRPFKSIQERIRALQSSGCCLDNETNLQSSRSNPPSKSSLNDPIPLDLSTDANHNETQEPSLFMELPTELKQRAASFLSVGEVLKLTETTKSIRSDLDMTVECSPLTDRASQDEVYRTFNTHQCFATVLPKQESLPHSMTFCCEVITFECDGEICIKEHNIPQQQSPEDLKKMSFSRGKVVAEMWGLRNEQKEQKVAVSFHPKSNKCYQFWIKTRSLDGLTEALRFENMKLYRTCFGARRLDYTAYQYDVHVQRQRARRRRFGVK